MCAMARSFRVFQVDAFTRERFTGNPAAVVLDAEALSETEMTALARELHSTDTAFVLPPEGPDHDLRVRFLTPRTETGFVGHATVAVHYVLGNPPGRLYRQRQRSGVVEVEVRGTDEARRIAIRQPPAPIGREISGREHLAVLDALALSTDDVDPRCPPRVCGASGRRLLVGVRGSEQLAQLRPDMHRLTTLSAQLGVAGFFVFTLAPRQADCLTESRMFTPALGIPEDPVSGNAHGILAAYLLEHRLLARTPGRSAFCGTQGHAMGRPGQVEVETDLGADGLEAVWIIGQAVLIFETTIEL